jgi:glutamyl-tRNA reductase
MELMALGTNHTTAPADIRDALFMDSEEVAQFLRRLRTPAESTSELVVLSTCNRTELYAATTNAAATERELRATVTELKGVDCLENGDYSFCHSGKSAALHLLRVASGLESLMVGEPQILGQVKDALTVAEDNKAPGALLTRLFNTAVHTGKRARSETVIGRGAVSVAYAAVVMARKVFADLSKHKVLVLGAGETGKLAAKHFHDEKPAKLTVMNRTFKRAARLAEDLDGDARPFEELSEALVEADVVVSATASPEPVITTEHMESAVKARGRRSVVLVDIASPRDIDPAVSRLANVFLYDMDALESVVKQNRAARVKEIPKVERIVDDELNRFCEWVHTLEVVPVVRALRRTFLEIGERETLKQAKRFHRTDREALKKYTQALINKLLHHPTLRIKELDRSTTVGFGKLAAMRDLFGLEPESGDDAGNGCDGDTD